MNYIELLKKAALLCGSLGIPPKTAPFPDKLAKDMIMTWSNEGDIVLDPMAGSGTTLLECVKANRHYIGFEISEDYFNLMCHRLDEIEREVASDRNTHEQQEN